MIVTCGDAPVSVSNPEPLFVITKSLIFTVPVSIVPKSVPSPTIGVTSPSGIEFVNPVISISGISAADA